MPSESEPAMPPSPCWEDLTQRRKESQRVAESSFSLRSSAILCVSALRLVWFFFPFNRAAPLTTLLGLLAFTPSALAQPAPPHIGYVYPAGGRQGAVFQVAVGGRLSQSAGSPAGALCARLEQIFVFDWDDRGRECVEGADSLLQSLRAHSYAWLVTQAMLEEGSCAVSMGELERADVIERTALERASSDNYP